MDRNSSEGKEFKMETEINLTEMVVYSGNKVVTDSRRVAKYFGKEHKHVIRDIEALSCSAEFRESNFGLSSYLTEQNQEKKQYLLTKDGFMFLAMGYTGEKAGAIKEAYINAFNTMEDHLRPPLKKPDIHPIQKAESYLVSYLNISNLLGAPESVAKANAVQNIKNEFLVDLNPLLTHNISTVQDKLYTPTELGKEYSMSAYAINKVLERLGLQIKNSHSNWELTAEGKKYGVYLEVGKKHSSGSPIQQIKWYAEKISKLIQEK